MKLGKIYEKVIEFGKSRDPRGIKEVEAQIEDNKKTFKDLKGIRREIFDREKLKNPYSDSRILHGDPDTQVKTVLVGIDMEGPELLLAQKLREKRNGPDLVIAHHPEGRALARLADVMGMQSEILATFGVPINVAESLMASRVAEVDRSISPGNHNRSVDMARLLDIPMMCMHTPADNHVVFYLQELFDLEKPRKVKDIVDLLYEHEEYKSLAKTGSPVTVFVGDENRKAGGVFVDMTGGTSGNKKIYEKLSQAGVGTIVGMHISEEHRKLAEENHLNVVIAGHISSDSLGMNLLIDRICRIEPLKIIPCSGFIRVDRVKSGASGKISSKPKKKSKSGGGSSGKR